jgi:hypothetical protein
VKVNEVPLVMLVQTPDRLVQAAFGLLARQGPQGIVDPLRPVLSLESPQDGLFIG